MKQLMIIGNWKMNKNFSETAEFIEDFYYEYKQNKKNLYENIIFGIAPSFINIPALKLNRVKNMQYVAQDVSSFEKHSRTGEVSAEMLKDLDVKYVIIGHSERRKYCNETNQIINKKAKLAIEAGLTPIVCVGESLEEFENKKTKEVIKKQIKEVLENIDESKVIITYEPIWAIGSGESATEEIISEIIDYIHSILNPNIQILYGGSVCPENIQKICEIPGINGCLVGNASLDVKKFIKLLTLNK